MSTANRQQLQFYSLDSEYAGRFVPQGRAFADESHRLLEYSLNTPFLPLLQGVAVLWQYETNVGNTALASGLLEKLLQLHDTTGFDHVDAFLHTTVESDRAIRARHAIMFTAWGFYCLDS